jgi:hypothetical protein
MPSTNGHGPKRAILYARVSTDEQARSGYSLALTDRSPERFRPPRGLRHSRGGHGCRPKWCQPGEARHGPRARPRGRWWCLSGAGAG